MNLRLVCQIIILTLMTPMIMALSTPQKMGYMLRSVGYGLKLMMGRMSVEKVLSDPQLSEVYGEKLAEVARIKHVAGSFGLKTDRYSHMIFPPGDPEVVSYLVVASERLVLQALEYSFPFVGKINYLGYFHHKDRDAKARELTKDYDVALTRAGAFSLLGYLSDPIFPSMLSGSRWAVAELFIHEMVHGTIWIKDAHIFNENLADFIAGQITYHYLKSENDLEEIEKQAAYITDRKHYARWLEQLKDQLTELYAGSSLSDDQKTQKKAEIFASHTSHKPSFHHYDFVGDPKRWNNARVVLSQIYAPDFVSFEQLIRCSFYKTKSDQLKHLIRVLADNIHQIRSGSSDEIISQCCDLLKSSSS